MSGRAGGPGGGPEGPAELPPEVAAAFEVARQARRRAYAPYSHFQVGAALAVRGQTEAVPGCNVENASYGGTICAERGAILAAVARYGADAGFDFLTVLADTAEPVLPCAFCRGVLAEFCGPDFPLWLGNTAGAWRRTTLGELLPDPFRL